MYSREGGEENSGLDAKKSKSVEEKVSAASDGVIAPEESDSWIGAKRWESSLFKVDQELTGKDGKMRASDEVIERKNTIKIEQRGKGNERSRIAMTE